MVAPAIIPAEAGSLRPKDAAPELATQQATRPDKPGNPEKIRQADKFAEVLHEKQSAAANDQESGEVSLQKLITKLKKILTGKGSPEDKNLEELLKKITNLAEKINKKSARTGKPPVLDLDQLLEKIKAKAKGEGEGKGNDAGSVLQQILTVLEKKISAGNKSNIKIAEQTPPPLTALNQDSEGKTGKTAAQNSKNNSPKVVIVDLRPKSQPDKNKHNARIESGPKKETAAEKINIKEPEQSQLNQKDIKYFSSADQQGNDTGTGNSHKQATFSDAVTKAYQGLSQPELRKLQDNLKSEIVKNTGIILKNNNNGEIRLILKPEALGRVKINVNLHNNHIDGRILVENNSVRQLFESSLESLNQAFKEGGFTSVSLQVAVGDGNRDYKREKELELSRQEASREFEKSIPLFADLEMRETLVNLMV